MKTLRIAAIALLCAAVLPACKKSKNTEPDPPPITTPTDGTRLQLSLDSLYLYAKESYLWYDAIPDYNTFNPRQYAGTDELASLKTALNRIAQLKVNPLTTLPYEHTTAGAPSNKYSFVESGNLARGIKGEVNLEGDGNDLGFAAVIVTFTGDGSKAVFVRYVEKGSPAAAAGLTRGCQITRMNGAAAPLEVNALLNAMNGTSMSLNFTRPDGTTGTASLTKGAYKNDPVTVYKVLPASGTNITGYINLMRFSRTTVASPSLDAAFKAFSDAGVNNLVVDLRYNGGGYVETFEYLANLMAPASLNGKVMYKEQFNTLLQTGKAPILKSIPLLDGNYKQRYSSTGKALTYADVDYTIAGNTKEFAKKGSLGALKNIVFLVTGNSASASELTINSFLAYPETVTVKLVGAKTYGKPVGFFGIGIDKFTVYMSQFTSTNAKDKGEYFAGMDVNIAAQDNVTRDFGDPLETMLAKALAFINTGATGRIAADAVTLANGRTIQAADMQIQTAGGDGFNGMIEERRVLKED